MQYSKENPVFNIEYFWSMPNRLFQTNDETFNFEVHGVVITCQRLNIPRSTVYWVQFSSKRKPITIARAKFEDSADRWTSIPEGRQTEAEGVGKLIDQYLSQKK